MIKVVPKMNSLGSATNTRYRSSWDRVARKERHVTKSLSCAHGTCVGVLELVEGSWQVMRQVQGGPKSLSSQLPMGVGSSSQTSFVLVALAFHAMSYACTAHLGLLRMRTFVPIVKMAEALHKSQ